MLSNFKQIIPLIFFSFFLLDELNFFEGFSVYCFPPFYFSETFELTHKNSFWFLYKIFSFYFIYLFFIFLFYYYHFFILLFYFIIIIFSFFCFILLLSFFYFLNLFNHFCRFLSYQQHLFFVFFLKLNSQIHPWIEFVFQFSIILLFTLWWSRLRQEMCEL